MNERANAFRRGLSVEPKNEKDISFNPDAEAKNIEKQQLREFAKLVSGTDNENLIAFKDKKMQELINYIMATIIIENQRINTEDTFPIQILSRFKSDKSLANKLKEYSDEGRKDMCVKDYFGIKIVPEAEHSVFYSNGDVTLQKMIDKREEVRLFIVGKYKELSEKPTMTFAEYVKSCNEVIKHLIKCFPKEATARKKHYNTIIKKIEDELQVYQDTVEDPNEDLSLNEIGKMTDVNIKKLLTDLNLCYADEVKLYKLRSDLMNVFTQSPILKGLRNYSF